MLQHILTADENEAKHYIKEIVDFEKNFPDHVKKYLATLASAVSVLVDHGWYLPWPDRISQGDLTKIVKLVKRSKWGDIENFLVDFYECRVDAIQNEMTDRFPARKDALDQAFTAHRTRQYFLSIPVFLAQADGIFVELTQLEKGIFQRQKSLPMTQVWVSGLLLDDFTESYLQHLNRTSTLIFNKAERTEQSINHGINRHAILHGESTDYGQRVNSFKALSFLYFVKTTGESATDLPPLT